MTDLYRLKKPLFFMLQIPNYAPKATFNLKRLNFTHNKGLDSAIKVEEHLAAHHQ